MTILRTSFVLAVPDLHRSADATRFSLALARRPANTRAIQIRALLTNRGYGRRQHCQPSQPRCGAWGFQGRWPRTIRPAPPSRRLAMTTQDSRPRLQRRQRRRDRPLRAACHECAARSPTRWRARSARSRPAPDMTMAHVLVAYLNLLGTEPAASGGARRARRGAGAAGQRARGDARRAPSSTW